MRKRITNGRMAHMHNVAEYMYLHAKDYGLEDQKEEMYVLGLLHDIGAVRDANTHNICGMDIMRHTGIAQKYLTAIEWHMRGPDEFCKHFGITEEQIPKHMLLLWDADLHVTSTGKIVTIRERLNDIRIRHNRFIGLDDDADDGYTDVALQIIGVIQRYKTGKKEQGCQES